MKHPTRLDRVASRQRDGLLRDKLFAAFGALLVIFMVFAFSTSNGLAAANAGPEIAPAPTTAEQIEAHTAQVCGDEAPAETPIAFPVC